MFLYNYFNPHFRKGSDGDLQSATNIIAISIHTSAREVTPFPLPDDRACRFQSTLPQGKWPALDPYLDSIAEISIHTSAREVTKQPDVRRHRDGISIHTSAREVTKKTMTMMMRQKNFNPHFRKGSDKEELRLFLFCKEISIHTSAREVTVWSDSLAEPDLHFNPHFRKGSDSAGCPRYCHYDDFNPHFRKGSDGTQENVWI